MILQVVGYVTPGWEILSYTSTQHGIEFANIDHRFSLWYTCSDDGCDAGIQDVTGIL